MVNFWNEVDEALDKGKEDKLVKVRAKDLADFRTKLTELENEISFAQNRNQTLTEIKMDMAKQIELLQKSQSSLDHTVEGQIHNQAEMIEEIEKELGEKQKEFADFQAKVEKKDRLILEFKQKLEEAINKIKSQVTQNNDLSTRIQQLELQNVDLQAELFQAKNEEPLSEEELAKQEQALNTLERENKRLEVDLGERDTEIQILKGKLENLTLNPQSGHRDGQIIEMQTELEKNTRTTRICNFEEIYETGIGSCPNANLRIRRSQKSCCFRIGKRNNAFKKHPPTGNRTYSITNCSKWRYYH